MRPPVLTTFALVACLALCAGCDSGTEAVPSVPGTPTVPGGPPGPDAPAVSWAPLALPAAALSAEGIVATERGDVLGAFIVSAPNGGDGAAFALQGGLWRRLAPPAELADFEFGYIAGGLGAQRVAEGSNRDNSNGPVSFGGNFLLVSADGSTFARTPTTPSYSSNDVQGFATNGRGVFLLVLEREGLLRSSDGGATWPAVTDFGSDRAFGQVTFVSEQTAFANAVNNPGSSAATWRLLRSPDAGATWGPALPATDWFYSVVRGAGGRVLAFARALLYTSADDGAAWARVALPAGGGDVAAALATPAGGLVVALERQRSGEAPSTAVFYSPDGGGTWSAAESGLEGVLAGPARATAAVQLPGPAARNEGLVRDAAGNVYLLLSRVNRETGAAESIVMRTTRPVP